MKPKTAARTAMATTLGSAALVVTANTMDFIVSSAHAYGLAGIAIFVTGTLAHISTLLGDSE